MIWIFRRYWKLNFCRVVGGFNGVKAADLILREFYYFTYAYCTSIETSIIFGLEMNIKERILIL